MKYRVFHYGLEFRVGNWSFDKAKWRHMDVVNKCWAKFPDPPDPSSLDRSNEDSLQRDLLSIECANSLNKALHSYHERKKCPDPNSLSTPTRKTPHPPSLSTLTQKSPHPPSLSTLTQKSADPPPLSTLTQESLDPPSLPAPTRVTTTERIMTQKSPDPPSRKFEDNDSVDVSRRDLELKNESQRLPPPAETNQTFSSMRFWIIGLWVVSIFGFMAVMLMMISRRRVQRKRGKTFKTKRRTTHSGFWDRTTEVS